MPMAYGYPLHNDDSHTGSAKRNGAGGVAALGLFRELLAYAKDHSGIQIANDSPSGGSASLFTPGPDGSLEILLNAKYEGGQYVSLNPAEVCWKMRLDPTTGELSMEWSDVGFDPCVWSTEPWIMPMPRSNIGSGKKYTLAYQEDNINIPVGQVIGNTPVMQYWAYRKVAVVEVEVINDGGVVTTFSFGWTMDATKFMVNVPNLTGQVYNSDGSAYTEPDWDETQGGADPFRITLQNPPLLRPATFLVRYWYWRLI